MIPLVLGSQKSRGEGVAVHIPQNAEKESGCAALAVVTAQVFLVTNLHKDVAVRTKTKECNGEQIHHCGASGGETQEQRDGVCCNQSVQNIYPATTSDLAW